MKETQTTLAHAIHLCSSDNGLEYKRDLWDKWHGNDEWIIINPWSIEILLETVTIRTKQTAKDELISDIQCYKSTNGLGIREGVIEILEKYNIVKRE